MRKWLAPLTVVPGDLVVGGDIGAPGGWVLPAGTLLSYWPLLDDADDDVGSNDATLKQTDIDPEITGDMYYWDSGLYSNEDPYDIAWVQFPSAPIYGTDDFTFEFTMTGINPHQQYWFRQLTSGDPEGDITGSPGDGIPIPSQTYNISIKLNGNVIRFERVSIDPGESGLVDSATNVNDEDEHVVRCTFSYANRRMRIYIDGSLDAEDDFGGGSLDPGSLGDYNADYWSIIHAHTGGRAGYLVKEARLWRAEMLP
jgi:hypothetical protein